jgi:uncharacterized protein YodC (DUF2158 family)
MNSGDMVRADGGGPLMKILEKQNGAAFCVWIDQAGSIHAQYFEFNRLSPFWLFTGPKTTWPEVTDLPGDFEGLNVSAKKGKKQRGSSRRPKASKKIKGRRNAAA